MVDNYFIQRLNEKDVISFNLIFKILYPALLYSANKNIKDAHHAEDMVMHVFYKLWIHEKPFSSYDHLRRFLFRTLFNACNNFRNLYNNSKQSFIDTSDVEVESLEKDTSLEREMMYCLSKLKNPYKQVLELHIYGLTYKEISSIIGKDMNNVYVIKNLAIKQLKKLLIKSL